MRQCTPSAPQPQAPCNLKLKETRCPWCRSRRVVSQKPPYTHYACQTCRHGFDVELEYVPLLDEASEAQAVGREELATAEGLPTPWKGIRLDLDPDLFWQLDDLLIKEGDTLEGLIGYLLRKTLGLQGG